MIFSMDLDGQKRVQKHFEEMFRSGVTPWTQHKKEPLLSEFFNLLKKDNPKAKILDIGCGNGWISIKAAKRGFNVWGVDSSETAIRQAKVKARKEGLKKRTHFRVGSALNLLYQDDFFDALIDRGLFHHILPENREVYFENILRVLKGKALVFLLVFSMRNPEGIGQRFTKKLISGLFGKDFKVARFEEDPWPTQNPAHLLHVIFRRTS